MPYNTKGLLTDTVAKPIPQYFNPTADSYEPLYGRNGAMRVELYDASGNPINVSGGALQVHQVGRNVQPTVEVLTTTPLAAGASFVSNWRDISTLPGVYAVGWTIYADTVVTVSIQVTDGVTSRSVTGAFFALEPNRVNIIPAITPAGRNYRIVVTNQSATAQTNLRVEEIRYTTQRFQPQNLRVLVARGLQIRDTSPHTSSTDPYNIFGFTRTIFGGGKVPIFIRNGLNQNLTVNIQLNIPGMVFATLGSVTVDAGASQVITNQNFAGLDVPSEQITLSFSCSNEPTSGQVDAYIDNLVGGV